MILRTYIYNCNFLKQGVADKLMQLAEVEIQEAGLVKVKYQPDLEQKLTSLDSEVSKVIDARLSIHGKINDYRAYLASTQAWLDELSNKLEPLEKGGGLILAKKVEYVNQILVEFDGGSTKLDEVKKSANEIMSSVSNVDCQMVEEQIKSVDRRFGEMKKRISRKQQILGTTVQSYEDFKKDLDTCKQEIESKSAIDLDMKVGFEANSLESYHQSLKASLKEIESKQAVLDTLDRRLTTLQPELEEVEIIEAENALANVLKIHSAACESIRAQLGSIADALGSRKRFMERIGKVLEYLFIMLLSIY